MDESESNAFARAVGGKKPLSAAGKRARLVLGVALTLILAGCITISLVLLGGLIVRGIRRGDYIALGAATAVILMTFAMARGRRKKK